MEKGKHVVNAELKQVTFGHVTKTIDGEILLTTTFDFSKVSMDRLLKRAADAELIAWRAKSGIKGLTTVEAAAKLQDATIDCSAIAERVKHVETEEEKQLKSIVKELLAKNNGANIKELLAKVNAMKEAQAQAELEGGESTE